MTQRRTILTVDAISDDDCGMYRIGEIDTMPESQVRAYIKRHGEYGYAELLEFGASLLSAAKKCIIEYRHEQDGLANCASVVAEQAAEE